jgi:hypothetical protein
LLSSLGTGLRLFPAPEALGGAAWELPQRSSPQIRAPRRNMETRGGVDSRVEKLSRHESKVQHERDRTSIISRCLRYRDGADQQARRDRRACKEQRAPRPCPHWRQTEPALLTVRTTPTHLTRASCALVSRGNNSCDIGDLYCLLCKVVSTYSLVAAMIDLNVNCSL